MNQWTFPMILRSLVAAAGIAGLISVSLVFGQDRPTRLTFEVMSIKPWRPGQPGGGITPLPGGQEYRTNGAPVIAMISLMYKIPIFQIIDGPDWINTSRWNIQAKAGRGGYTLDELHEMYQNMLADQFKLKFHRETKEGPVYALTVDKSGLKMKINNNPEPLKASISGNSVGPDGFVGHSVQMQYLTWWLGQLLQEDRRPVINKTGLDGYYDFKLAYLPELAPDFPRDRVPPDALNRPNIFQAVREQLGLRLEPQKGPVEYFIVDSIEKPATN
jgi:uncharacterized protein (TIGR03435 family)